MNQGGWYSKKAVIKDIVRATGMKEFDENTFVIGERPPPSRTDTEDNLSEMLYRYGGAIPESGLNEFEKPDLNGITAMLRMVDTYNDTIEVSKTTNTKNEISVDNIVTISKLNPNVKEFFPTASTNTCVIENNDPVTNTNEKNELVDSSKGLKHELKCNSELKTQNELFNPDDDKKLVNSAVQVNDNNKNEINLKEMREKLKTKISSTSNASCFKVKHERNLAIISLLKLHSQAPVIETNIVKPDPLLILDSQKHNSVISAKDVPFKLMPPNFYEQSSSTQKDKVNDKSENIAIFPTTNINEKIIENLQSNTNNTLCNHTGEKVADNVTTSNINEKITVNAKKNMRNILSIDNVHKKLNVHDSFENSVDKVTKWLEFNNGVEAGQSQESLEKATEEPDVSNNVPPENGLKVTTNDIPHKKKVKTLNKSSPANPSIYLGPVTFRKKEIPISNSPSLCSSDKTTRKTPSSTYVPSAYANELSKTYMERANAKQIMEEDIWSKLEDELKKRDAILIKKKMEEDETIQSTTSSIRANEDLE